jgi:hypothetical protein
VLSLNRPDFGEVPMMGFKFCKSLRQFLIQIKVLAAVWQKAGAFTNRWPTTHENFQRENKSNYYFNNLNNI